MIRSWIYGFGFWICTGWIWKILTALHVKQLPSPQTWPHVAPWRPWFWQEQKLWKTKARSMLLPCLALFRTDGAMQTGHGHPVFLGRRVCTSTCSMRATFFQSSTVVIDQICLMLAHFAGRCISSTSGHHNHHPPFITVPCLTTWSHLVSPGPCSKRRRLSSE